MPPRHYVSSICLSILLTSIPTTSDRALAQELPVTTHSKEARALFELGRLHAFHYQEDQALEYLDAALAVDSTFVLAHLHRGGMSLSGAVGAPYFAKAEAYRGRVTPGEDRLVDAFVAFQQNGNPERAIEIFTELADDYPDDPYLPTYLGLRYLRNLQEYDEAIRHFERALERDSAFVQASNWLGYAALAKEDYEAAERAFLRYQRGAPDEPRPYNSLGDLYFRKGEFEKAADYYEKAVERYPRFEISKDKLILAELTQVHRRFEEAFAQQDPKLLASFFSSDAAILQDGGETVRGADAIEDFWQDTFEAGLTGIELENSELFSGSDGAIRPTWLFSDPRSFVTEIGRYRLMTAGEETDAGKYVVIWLQTPEGWKIYRDISNSDRASSDT